MEILALVKRNLRRFFRDKTAVLLSLVSVIIMVILYGLFLAKVQADNIQGDLQRAGEALSDKNALYFINTWLMAGTMVVCIVNTVLSASQGFIKDVENGTNKDITLTPMARYKLVASYMLSNALISFLMTCAVFVVSQIYIVAFGGRIMSFVNILYTLGILLLCVFSFSCMVGYLATFLKSTGAFTAICAITGVMIGFFAGIYLPIGMFPKAIQTILCLLPFTHAAMLFRIPFMHSATGAVFINDHAAQSIQKEFGLVMNVFGLDVTPAIAFAYIALIGAIFFILSIFRISKKL